jgi:hypothetical protein
VREGERVPANDLLRRITGGGDTHDSVESVARELRRRHDDPRERRRRQRASAITERNPRLGTRRSSSISAVKSGAPRSGAEPTP